MKEIDISTNNRQEIIDITSEIKDFIAKENVKDGLICVYSPHTTAGITVNENADPDVTSDITNYLNKTVPEDFGFNHIEGNSDAHIKGSLMNFSQSFIIENGQIQLGTWQGIYFCEFDGPRNRKIWLKIVS